MDGNLFPFVMQKGLDENHIYTIVKYVNLNLGSTQGDLYMYIFMTEAIHTYS